MTSASVAVIVPNHRRISELAAALASVKAQTYQGPVRTYLVYQPRPEIRPLLESLDESVVPIPFEPDGSVAAIAAQRNVGIRTSDEDLIAFLDDDDLWHPEKLSRQVAAHAGETKAVATCTGWLRFLTPDEPKWAAPEQRRAKTLSRYQVVRSGLLMTSTMLVDGAVARRLLLDERPEWLGLDDYDFKLRVGEIGPIQLLPDPLAALRMDPSGTSRARPTLQYARALDVMCEWIRRGHKRPVDWMGFAVRCAVTGVFPEHRDDREAVALLKEALDGSVLGRIDAWIARAIEAAWRSTRLVPAIRGLVVPRVTR